MILGLKKTQFLLLWTVGIYPPKKVVNSMQDILELRDLRYRPSDFVTNSYGDF